MRTDNGTANHAGPGLRPDVHAAVYGCTSDNPEPHFLGWAGEVDPDELFESGAAWGVTVRRAAVAK